MPRILLVEPSATNQLVTESAIRRCRLSWDLAFDAQDAITRANQVEPMPYKIAMVSTEIGKEEVITLK
jgi:hypothetical protein